MAKDRERKTPSTALLFSDRIHYLDTGLDQPLQTPRRGTPVEEARLGEEALDLLRKGPPVEWLILASTIPASVMDTSLRSLPLGQGEVVWKGEIRRQWNVTEEIVARHYPTTKGAQAYAVYKADLERLFAARRSLKRIDLLPLLVAHAAQSLGEEGLAAFYRPRYLALAYRSSEGLEAVAEFTPRQGEEVDEAFFLESVERLTYASREGYRRILFLSSPPFKGLPVEVETLPLTPEAFPPALGWTRPKGRSDPLHLASLFLGTLLLGMAGYYAYLGLQLDVLGRQKEALEGEKRALTAQMGSIPSLKGRIADLEGLLAATSTRSPTLLTVRALAEATPDGVYVGNLSVGAQEVRLTLYSKAVPPLAEAATRYAQALEGEAPKAFRIAAIGNPKGWFSAELAFPKGGGTP